ncbi:hypothetical protein PSTG_08460 [Puccinia striiformis f. sp. tritici PST-78]|uniref:Uncharacterized protein n=1 Tax=Puccinia striiformis f. sp. tritici PST-78 TaxID=1165861 RepID=A0A0L0VG11_9BASI|nr:hypothetical protein PSTG_08460 [Puccinia striiformis f. sp. tritici PST-78]
MTVNGQSARANATPTLPKGIARTSQSQDLSGRPVQAVLGRAVRQEVGLGCPSRCSRLLTARTGQSNKRLDAQIRELLGWAGPRTHQTSSSEQLICAVPRDVFVGVSGLSPRQLMALTDWPLNSLHTCQWPVLNRHQKVDILFDGWY